MQPEPEGAARPRVIPFLLAVSLLPCIGLACSGALGRSAEGEGYAAFRSFDGEAILHASPVATVDTDLGDAAEAAADPPGDGLGVPRAFDPLLPGLAPLADRLDEIRRAAAAAASPQVRPGTIVVTGEGAVRAAPDAATLRLGIVSEDESATAAVTRNAATVQTVRAALLEVGLEAREITTEQVHLEPIRPDALHAVVDRTRARHRARTGMTVEIGSLKDGNFAHLGDIAGRAVDAGATEVSGPDFKVSDEARATARKAAVDDALVKAATFAHALGAKLGRLVQIREGDAAGETGAVRTIRAASSSRSHGGGLEVSSRVTVVWEVR
ncbi:hypothetical protein BHAOGJBA_1276 [Methylobacterium hispanicum]|uniref:DUF541 domain-containing protein n=1 Tax=Methylobacterium hispanicum TaxID=270350 RepID=A0AAV4ZH60_9HYPH|nr:SIMPL domain-containing protein [Methylobacterium hispanicum]GJD87771.1 hypothetical protein BHAOGJBA_1276 [Methylobacterium hispanicum]